MEKLTEQQIDEMARVEKNKYQKEWYKRHEEQGTDKRKEYARRHWRKKALEQLKKQENLINSRGL